MTKKNIVRIIMLVLLAAGIACVGYGVTGTKIYKNAAALMGSDEKTAMTYIQDPSSLTELGTVEKIGAEKMKAFLTSLGEDSAKVEAAVSERQAYEAAVENTKDRAKFLEYAQSVDETVTEDNLNDLIKDHARSDPMKEAMAMEELGLDEEAFKAVAGNEVLLGMYRDGLPIWKTSIWRTRSRSSSWVSC